MEKRRVMVWIMVFAILVTSVCAGNIPVKAASSKVSTKMYTISKKPGTYQKTLNVTIKVKKGYKAYYTTGKKLSASKIIKSGKSKKLKIKKTTTLKIYAVKKNVKVTKKQLTSKKVLKKAKSYKYKIKKKADSATPAPSGTSSESTSASSAPASSSPGENIVTSGPDGSATPAPGMPGTTETPDPGNTETPEPGNTETPDPEEEVIPEKETFGSTTSGTLVSNVGISEQTFEVPSSEDTTVTAEGSDGEYVKVTLPEGSFSENTEISVRAEGGKVEIRQTGKDFARLNQLATVQITLPEKPDEKELDYYKAAYYFGDTTYFIDPDREQLKKGILEFETAHFSWFGATKLSEAEMQERMARNKALDEVTLEYKQKAIQSVIDDLASESLSKLGIAEGSSAYTAISRSLGQSTEFYNLIKIARENDHEAAMQKLAEITITTLSENPEYLSSTKVNIASSIVGNTGNLVKAYRNGEYVEAFNAVMKTYADTIPAVKWGKAAVSVWQTGVDWIKDYETDAAYQVFLGEIRDGEHGVVLSNDGSGTDGWNRVLMQMQTTINQKVIEMKRSGSKSYMDYTAEETAEMRALVTEQLQNMFVNRYQKEQEIEKKVKEKKEILNALGRENLLSLLFYGDYVNNDYEVLCERMMRIYDSVKEMVGEENLKLLGDSERSELAYMTYLFVDESWANGKKALGGRAAVFQYMKEKYNVDIDDYNVNLSETEITLTETGQTASIELFGAGSSSTTWSSSNSNVATVAPSGEDHNIAVITAKNSGLCIIRSTHNGKIYECWVNVTETIEMGTEEIFIYTPFRCEISKELEERVDQPNVKWYTTSFGSLEEFSSDETRYGATFWPGKESGNTEICCLVEGRRLYRWIVTVKEPYISVGYYDDVDGDIHQFDTDSDKNVVELDMDYEYEDYEGNTVKIGDVYFTVIYHGPDPEAAYGWESEEYVQARNFALSGMKWECDGRDFLGNTDRDDASFRNFFMGKAHYIGDKKVSLIIPNLTKTLSVTIRVKGTPEPYINGNLSDGNLKVGLDRVFQGESVEWRVDEGEIFITGTQTDDSTIWKLGATDAASEWYRENEQKSTDQSVVISATWNGNTYYINTTLKKIRGY